MKKKKKKKIEERLEFLVGFSLVLILVHKEVAQTEFTEVLEVCGGGRFYAIY